LKPKTEKKMKLNLITSLSAFFLLIAATGYSQTVQPAKMVPASEFYPGGMQAMYQFINSKAIYPPVAKRNRIQGECIIGVTINPDGTVSNFKVIKNIGGGAGEEAMRLVKLLKFKEIGYKLDTSIPVVFKL